MSTDDSNVAALDRGARRYLELLKGALLDEHYLEHELRISYLVSCIEKGSRPDDQKLRDPARFMRAEIKPLLAARRAGRLSDSSDESNSYFPYTEIGRVRLDHLQRCLEAIRDESVQGDLVECGTGRGGAAIFMRGFLDAYEILDTTVWVADRFRASPEDESLLAGGDDRKLPGGGHGFPKLLADLNTVRDAFDRFGLNDERVRFLQGSLGITIPDAGIEQIAMLRIGVGPDVEEHLEPILDVLHDRISVGGFVLIEDYSRERRRTIIDDFRVRSGIDDDLVMIDSSAACWRKTHERTSRARLRGENRRARTGGVPLAPAVPASRTDLSVIVCVYNMQREALRTLRSLSRSYQQGVEDLGYEVIVVENGSAQEQRLGPELVESFGPEFRYLDLGPEATPTPVDALNKAIALSSGNACALMIDGAHVLTPGALHYGMVGLDAFEPAVVSIQQWYVGPGQQGDMMMSGYDQAYEDRLFDEISWPTDGYRMFDIGHFIGDRDWFDGIWESNCLFVPRALLEQSGCFDEAFSMPGGGYTNLEFYERVAASAGVNVVTVLGEGSFHQIHGGITTNEVDVDAREASTSAYGHHYSELRGRPFHGPGKPMHYVGRMVPGAIRTRARRRIARSFQDVASDPDGVPDTARPIPEELRRAFIEAFWQSLAWREASWLGHKLPKTPTDLFAYQEIIAQTRPDWIIETRAQNGVRALFFASICELLDHGKVISIDPEESDTRPSHPRIVSVVGPPAAKQTVRRVRALTGDSANALVVIGARANRQAVIREFQAYSPLVPVGSYVVVEDTILNGNPVWPGFGAGPAEAVKHIVGSDGFRADPRLERYGLTLNPGGFLKRRS